jgi:hypothetical protein
MNFKTKKIKLIFSERSVFEIELAIKFGKIKDIVSQNGQ